MRLTNKDYIDRVGEAFDDLVFLANINPNDVCKFPIKNLREQELKLGQLEDIEEELGIDLITLFKAWENGIWCKCCLFDDVKISHRKPDFISLKNKCLIQECDDGSLHSSNYFVYYYFKDCGKTWALTKEELL